MFKILVTTTQLYVRAYNGKIKTFATREEAELHASGLNLWFPGRGYVVVEA